MSASSQISVITADGPRLVRDGKPWRAATLLCPLYAWTAGLAWIGPWDWAEIARAACTGDPAAMQKLVYGVGGEDKFRQALWQHAGIEWPRRANFDRVPVTGIGAASGFHRLLVAAGAGDERAQQVLTWMGQLPDEARFGVDRLWARMTGQEVTAMAISSGWGFWNDEPAMRTHIAVLAPQRSAVVLTMIPVTQLARRGYAMAYRKGGSAEVRAMHELMSAPVIQNALAVAAIASRPDGSGEKLIIKRR